MKHFLLHLSKPINELSEMTYGQLYSALMFVAAIFLLGYLISNRKNFAK